MTFYSSYFQDTTLGLERYPPCFSRKNFIDLHGEHDAQREEKDSCKGVSRKGSGSHEPLQLGHVDHRHVCGKGHTHGQDQQGISCKSGLEHRKREGAGIEDLKKLEKDNGRDRDGARFRDGGA